MKTLQKYLRALIQFIKLPRTYKGAVINVIRDFTKSINDINNKML